MCIRDSKRAGDTDFRGDTFNSAFFAGFFYNLVGLHSCKMVFVSSLIDTKNTFCQPLKKYHDNRYAKQQGASEAFEHNLITVDRCFIVPEYSP